VGYKVEKQCPDGFAGDQRPVVQAIAVENSLMETRIERGGFAFTDPSHDLFKVKHCADILNFVLVKKQVETTIAETTMKHASNRTELIIEIRDVYDEVPGQYWDFTHRIIAHFHFVKGWLYMFDPPSSYAIEAMYLRHWLMAAIDGLTAECQSVFPKSARLRWQRYPATWRSKTLGGCLGNFQFQVELLVTKLTSFPQRGVNFSILNPS
jgi:hypothetical protein